MFSSKGVALWPTNVWEQFAKFQVIAHTERTMDHLKRRDRSPTFAHRNAHLKIPTRTRLTQQMQAYGTIAGVIWHGCWRIHIQIFKWWRLWMRGIVHRCTTLGPNPKIHSRCQLGWSPKSLVVEISALNVNFVLKHLKHINQISRAKYV